MIYAQLERQGEFGIVRALVDTPKLMDPPRYIDVTNISPAPAVGDWYNPRTAQFFALPPPAVLRDALQGVITALETAGLVTRTF